MRSITVKGVGNNLRIELGADTNLIGGVIEVGKAVDYLIYSARFNGKGVKEFVKKCAPDKICLLNGINDNEEYEIIAYDW